jgi:sugar-specific transcriptional regulator TrmB
MKKTDYIAYIQDLGLTENEAKVYLSALSLGSSTVLKIAKEAGIKRTTAYPLLETLKAKGLISSEIKGFKTSYVAEGPEKLEQILELKKERFKEILPGLKAMAELKGGESFIKYYEGVEGTRNVYNHILDDLKPGDDYVVISDMEQFLGMDPDYFLKFIERRAKYNLKLRAILQDTPDAHEHKSLEAKTKMVIKLLPPNTELTANMVVTPHRLIITQMTPSIMTIVIENKSIVQMQKEQFEIMWRALV